MAGQAERQDVPHMKARGRSKDLYNAVTIAFSLVTLDLTHQLVKMCDYDCFLHVCLHYVLIPDRFDLKLCLEMLSPDWPMCSSVVVF